jgi:hypothetical protein
LLATVTKTPGVWGYSSHFGTPCTMSATRTRYLIQVLSFHILAHSSALFCTHEKLNSLLFKRFRTLCTKTRGWGYSRASVGHPKRTTSACISIRSGIHVSQLTPTGIRGWRYK